MICGNCGGSIIEGQEICPTCGARLIYNTQVNNNVVEGNGNNPLPEVPTNNLNPDINQNVINNNSTPQYIMENSFRYAKSENNRKGYRRKGNGGFLLFIKRIITLAILIGGGYALYIYVVNPFLIKTTKKTVLDYGMNLTKSVDNFIQDPDILDSIRVNEKYVSTCVSIEYLYKKGLFITSKSSGYIGSVLITQGDEGIVKRVWITNGKYGYKDIDVSETTYADAIDINEEFLVTNNDSLEHKLYTNCGNNPVTKSFIDY